MSMGFQTGDFSKLAQQLAQLNLELRLSFELFGAKVFFYFLTSKFQLPTAMHTLEIRKSEKNTRKI